MLIKTIKFVQAALLIAWISSVFSFNSSVWAREESGIVSNSSYRALDSTVDSVTSIDPEKPAVVENDNSSVVINAEPDDKSVSNNDNSDKSTLSNVNISPTIKSVEFPSGTLDQINEYQEKTVVASGKPATKTVLNRNDDASDANITASFWQPVMALALVIGLIIAIAFVFKRFVPLTAKINNSGAIEILGRTIVNSRQSLCLVKMGRRLVLVGLSPNHMASIETIDDQDEVARLLGELETGADGSISRTFSNLFRREVLEYDDADSEEGVEIDNYKPDVDSAGPSVAVGAELNSLLDKVKGLAKIKRR